MVLYPAVPLVSINPEGSHNHPARGARALARGRLSLLLALEIASTGRAATNRDGTARDDPADEHRKSALGRTTRDGEPSCAITQRALPPWICRGPDDWLQTAVWLRDCTD